MNSFYVSKRYMALFFFVSFILFFIANFWYFLLWFFCFFLGFVFFRKTIIDYRDFLGKDQKILYTPVSGKVIKIDRDKNEMEFRLPFWGPFGIFLPAPCEVVDIEEKIRKHGPFKKAEIKIILSLSSQHQIVVKLYSCYTIFAPKLWIQPGDKGRLAANIGMLPFGGRVKVSCAGVGEMKINDRQWVFVGRTLIASLKDI